MENTEISVQFYWNFKGFFSRVVKVTKKKKQKKSTNNKQLLCFRFDALTELGAFMRTEFLCVSVLRVASGPRVKLTSCKSALNPPVVYSTDRSKAVVPVLVLLFVALWFILWGDLLYVFPCVILFVCF